MFTKYWKPIKNAALTWEPIQAFRESLNYNVIMLSKLSAFFLSFYFINLLSIENINTYMRPTNAINMDCGCIYASYTFLLFVLLIQATIINYYDKNFFHLGKYSNT